MTALTALVRELENAGHEVLVIHPGLFVTVPCTTYREIRLAAAPLQGEDRCQLSCQIRRVNIECNKTGRSAALFTASQVVRAAIL